MNHNQPMQPVGTCLKCKRLVFPPNFVSYPGGPVHKECDHPRSRLASIARVVGAVVVITCLGTCVCVKAVSTGVDSKRKQAQAEASENARLKAQEHEGYRLVHEEACPKLRDAIKEGKCEIWNGLYGLKVGTNVHAIVSCSSDKSTFDVVKTMKANANDAAVWSDKTMCSANMFREDGGVVPPAMAAKVKKALDSL